MIDAHEDAFAGRTFTREKRFKTRSPGGTHAIAATIAEMFPAPRLIVLRGELGAGKTTLVKGWAEALGADPDEVTSPTFTLIQEYKGRRTRLYHLDLYRLETERELSTLGLEDLLTEPDAVVLVEWGEKFASVRALAGTEVWMTHLEGDERAFLVRWDE